MIKMNMSNNIPQLMRLFQRKDICVDGNKIHVFPFNNFNPVKGKINIAWINDIRVKQLAMHGYMKGYLEQARRWLIIDRTRFNTVDYVITLNKSMFKEINTWLGNGRNKNYLQFMSYPNERHDTRQKREEIVYVDNSSTYTPDFWNGMFELICEIRKKYEIETVISPSHKVIYDALIRQRHTRIVLLNQYDYLSQWGILVNVHNFAQSVECLPRKIPIYLNAGMTPIVHDSFTETIKYLEQNNIEPYTYHNIDMIGSQLKKKHSKHRPELFSMEYRIKDLADKLTQIDS